MLRIVHHAIGTIARRVLPDAEQPFPTSNPHEGAASQSHWILKSNHDSLSWSDAATSLCCDILTIIDCDSSIFADTSSDQRNTEKLQCSITQKIMVVFFGKEAAST